MPHVAVATVLWPAIGSGLVQGCALALVAAGFTVIYRATGLINFANGQQLVFGGYIGWWLVTHQHFPFWLAALCAVLGGFLLGVAIERLVIGGVRKADLLPQVIVLFALAQALDGGFIDIFGAQAKATPAYAGQTAIVPGLNFSATDIVIICVTAGTLTLLGLLLYRTDIGARMRANADNEIGTRLVGINPRTMAMTAWGIGGAFASLSGAVIVPEHLLSPEIGSTFTFNAFAAVGIGGVGSVWGAVAGGLFVGVAEAVVATELNAGYESLVSVAVMIVVLTLRPTGLLGGRA
jgi:branched-chain amino acid transport system permease protein